jgi:Putative rRNA methylase
MKAHINYAHHYWERVVKPGDTIIDATVGNGFDTCFLAQLLKGKGMLAGYDIQPQALKQAKKRLKELTPEIRQSVHLKLQSHIHFEERDAKLIVYNLGYLPGGNKTLTTKWDTTLQSIQNALPIVSSGGAISITCYPRHEEGGKEQAALLNFLKTLPQAKWHICHHVWINRPLSPSLIWMQSAHGA